MTNFNGSGSKISNNSLTSPISSISHMMNTTVANVKRLNYTIYQIILCLKLTDT